MTKILSFIMRTEGEKKPLTVDVERGTDGDLSIAIAGPGLTPIDAAKLARELVALRGETGSMVFGRMVQIPHVAESPLDPVPPLEPIVGAKEPRPAQRGVILREAVQVAAQQMAVAAQQMAHEHPRCPNCDSGDVRHSGELHAYNGEALAEPVELLRCYEKGCWTAFRRDGGPYVEGAQVSRTWDEMPDRRFADAPAHLKGKENASEAPKEAPAPAPEPTPAAIDDDGEDTDTPLTITVDPETPLTDEQFVQIFDEHIWPEWPIRKKKDRALEAARMTTKTVADAMLLVRVVRARVALAKASNSDMTDTAAWSYTWFRAWREHLPVLELAVDTGHAAPVEPAAPTPGEIVRERLANGQWPNGQPRVDAQPSTLHDATPVDVPRNVRVAYAKHAPMTGRKPFTVLGDVQGAAKELGNFATLAEVKEHFPDAAVPADALQADGILRQQREARSKRKVIGLVHVAGGAVHAEFPFAHQEIVGDVTSNRRTFRYLGDAVAAFPGVEVTEEAKAFAQQAGLNVRNGDVPPSATVSGPLSAEMCQCDHILQDHLDDGPCVYNSPGSGHCNGFQPKREPARQASPASPAPAPAPAAAPRPAAGESRVIDLNPFNSHGQEFGVYDMEEWPEGATWPPSDYYAQGGQRTPATAPMRAYVALADAIGAFSRVPVTQAATDHAAELLAQRDLRIVWRGADDDFPFAVQERVSGRWTLIAGAKYLRQAMRSWPGVTATEEAKAEASANNLWEPGAKSA